MALLRGEFGWAEFAPFRDYGDIDCVSWLRAAVESATTPWPQPIRDRIEVNTTVPVVTPERALNLGLTGAMLRGSGVEAVTAVAFTHDGQRIVSGGRDGRVRTWAVSGRSQVMELSFKEHKKEVTCVRVSANDEEATSIREMLEGVIPDQTYQFKPNSAVTIREVAASVAKHLQL